MKQVINILSTLLIAVLLYSCASTRCFTVPVINHQGQHIQDTTILVRPYGLFCLNQRVEGVKYRMRWTNVFPLVLLPVTTGGWYLLEPKAKQNFVVKQ
jgi:hypothetical protein